MKELYNLFVRPKDPLSFNAVRISLASPEKIRSGIERLGNVIHEQLRENSSHDKEVVQ